MTQSPTKVLYILGTGRCGSTVLSNLVGSSQGYVSVGEIYYIWDRGFVENRLCGCGRQFSECNFWQQVVESAGISKREAKKGLEIREKWARTKNAFRPASDPELREFQDLMERVYRAVLQVSGEKVIVDSSKFPVYGAILADILGMDVFGLLLVRDPRAVAFSRSRQKKLRPDHPADVGPAYFEQHGILRSSSTWVGWNLLAEIKWRNDKHRFARIRYEEFVENPTAILALIGAKLGVEINVRRLGPQRYDIGDSHALSGNPVRFASGPLTLRADTEWVDSMPRSRKLAISCLTLPLLPRYGYFRG